MILRNLEDLIEKVEESVPSLMEQVHVPGLSLTLIRDAQVVWSYGSGVREANTDQAVTTETIFQAASLSKPVFAYAVLRLVEREVLALDRPLIEYLPASFEFSDPLEEDVAISGQPVTAATIASDPLMSRITARMVLCHTTSWPDWRASGKLLVCKHAPGERFGYSGEGYSYLQKVVEQITAQPLDHFLRHSILDPLEMSHSSYAWASPNDTAVAVAHNRQGQPIPRFALTSPLAAASLHTTPNDYARFLCEMLLPAGASKLLSDTWREEMLRPQIWPTSAIAWSLGWGLQENKHGRAFWHWGDNPGYKAFAFVYPEARTGLIMMTNGDGGDNLWEPITHLWLDGEFPLFEWLKSGNITLTN